jgi:hypothetical protein
MTRCLRPVLGAALIFIAIVAAPRPALAGGYDVYSCNSTVSGGANHSWGAVADGGMTAYTDCPAGQGLVARNVDRLRISRPAPTPCACSLRWDDVLLDPRCHSVDHLRRALDRLRGGLRPRAHRQH